MVAEKINYVLLTALLGVSTVVGTVFFFLKKDDRKVSIPSFIIYSIVTLLAFSGVGLTTLVAMESFYLFIVNQVVFLILGIIHIMAMYSWVDWTSRESFWHELTFTVFIALVGIVGYNFVFRFFNAAGYPELFVASIIAFFIPFFILKTFDFMLAIPELEYRKYYLPRGEIEIPEEFENDKSISIKFLIQRKFDHPYDELKAHVPTIRSEFGKFFPIAIADHNDKNPGHRIDHLDENKMQQGWLFYFEPEKWWKSKKYIDPDLTVAENGIEDYSVIIAERVS